jgi:hypothetical protein
LSLVEMVTSMPSRRALQRQRADHVVGLDAGHAQDREAQRLDDLASSARPARAARRASAARLALYWGYSASRKVGPEASITKAT